jgi:hypothetical protein
MIGYINLPKLFSFHFHAEFEFYPFSRQLALVLLGYEKFVPSRLIFSFAHLAAVVEESHHYQD